MKKCSLLVSVIGFLLLISCTTEKKPSNPVLLISVDGLINDYLDRFDAPNIQSIIDNGVLADGLIPVFPTKTFPNHYSLVTGLYTENTGMISNTMYDAEMNANYSMGNRGAVMDPRWYGGEPIWVTAELQGLTAGAMFWPGSEAPIKDTYATYWMPYDDDMPHFARVDTLISWLESDQKPDFMTLYFSRVDSYGHRYGPNADEIGIALSDVDAAIGYLISELERIGIWPDINILITSDHGMTEVSEERVIFLDDLISLDDVDVYDWTPAAMLQPKEGKKDEVFNALKAAENNYVVYKKEDIPDYFRVKNHHRVPEIMMIADIGYTITSKPFFERRGVSGGAHGYDHREPDMQAFFAASGPAFKSGEKVPPFEMIHIYELMTHMLGLQPAMNDGSIDSVRHLLNPTK